MRGELRSRVTSMARLAGNKGVLQYSRKLQMPLDLDHKLHYQIPVHRKTRVLHCSRRAVTDRAIFLNIFYSQALVLVHTAFCARQNAMNRRKRARYIGDCGACPKHNTGT